MLLQIDVYVILTRSERALVRIIIITTIKFPSLCRDFKHMKINCLPLQWCANCNFFLTFARHLAYSHPSTQRLSFIVKAIKKITIEHFMMSVCVGLSVYLTRFVRVIKKKKKTEAQTSKLNCCIHAVVSQFWANLTPPTIDCLHSKCGKNVVFLNQSALDHMNGRYQCKFINSDWN